MTTRKRLCMRDQASLVSRQERQDSQGLRRFSSKSIVILRLSARAALKGDDRMVLQETLHLFACIKLLVLKPESGHVFVKQAVQSKFRMRLLASPLPPSCANLNRKKGRRTSLARSS